MIPFRAPMLARRRQNPVATVFSVSGAWTWFNDPRAIAIRGVPLVGAITGAGNLMAYDMQGSAVDLRGSTFQADDHANPSFLKRSSDSRILAFASAHLGTGLYTYLSTNPGDPTSFGAETNIDSQVGSADYTYTIPIQLTGETDDPIWLLFRGDNSSGDQRWHYTKSTDQGATWAAKTFLFAMGHAGDIPNYIKAVQNGPDRFDIAITDGHPEEQATNSVYHCYYQGGSFRKTDGTALTLPITPSTTLDKVYDGTTTRAWVWDIQIDESGNPVIAYATFPSVSNHRYRYARFNGATWDDNEVCAGGHSIDNNPTASVGAASRQPYYSGGICIDPDDVDRVFASREVDGIHSLFRLVTADGGDTWSEEQVTIGEKAIRPFVVKGASEPRLLYIAGDYATFLDYDTSIKLIDSTTDAGAAATDPNRSDVILHVRAGSTEDLSPVGRTLTWGANVGWTGREVLMPGTSSTGGNGVIAAPDAADLAFTDFTIEIFGAKIVDPTAVNWLISQWRAAAGGRAWQVAYQGNLSPDRIGIYLSTDGTANTFVDDDYTPTANTAFDLCIERSGSTVRIYVGGTMIHSETFSGTLRNSPARMLIGAVEDSGGLVGITDNWEGRFKEIRITDIARYANDGGYSVPSLPLPTA